MNLKKLWVLNDFVICLVIRLFCPVFLFVWFIYKLLAFFFFFFFLGFWIYEMMNSILWYIVLWWYGTYKSWVSEGSSQSKYGQLIWDNESSFTYITVLGCLNDWSVCVRVWSMFFLKLLVSSKVPWLVLKSKHNGENQVFGHFKDS